MKNVIKIVAITLSLCTTNVLAQEQTTPFNPFNPGGGDDKVNPHPIDLPPPNANVPRLDHNFEESAATRWLMEQSELGNLKGFVVNPYASNVILDPWTAGCIWTGSSCKKPNSNIGPICDIENNSCTNGYVGSSINSNGYVGYFCHSYHNSSQVKYCGSSPDPECKTPTPFDPSIGCIVGVIGGSIEKDDEYIWTCEIGTKTKICSSLKHDNPDDKVDPKINPPVCGSQDYTCDTGSIGEIMPPRWTCTNDDITIDCGGNSTPPVCGSSVNTCAEGTLIENFNDEYAWQCKSGSETIDCSISPPSPTPPPKFGTCDCSSLNRGRESNWITVSNSIGGAPYCYNQDTGMSTPCPEGGLEIPPTSEPTSVSKCGYTVDDPSFDYTKSRISCNDEINAFKIMNESEFITFFNKHLKNFNPIAFRANVLKDTSLEILEFPIDWDWVDGGRQYTFIDTDIDAGNLNGNLTYTYYDFGGVRSHQFYFSDTFDGSKKGTYDYIYSGIQIVYTYEEYPYEPYYWFSQDTYDSNSTLLRTGRY